MNTRAVGKICITEQESKKVEKGDVTIYRIFPVQIVVPHQIVTIS